MFSPICFSLPPTHIFSHRPRIENEPKAPQPLLMDDAGFKCIQDTNLGRDKNSLQFWDFVERWRANRALKKLDSSNNFPKSGNGGNGSSTNNNNSATNNGLNGYSTDPSSSVSNGGSGRSDVKRYGTK